MSIQEELKKIIEEALKTSYSNFRDRESLSTKVLVEISKEKTHGDYATSVALALAKDLNKNPLDVAIDIVNNINIHANIRTNVSMEKVEAVPPGFINFFLSKEFFANNLKKVLKEKDKFGKNSILKNKKVIIEYTDPNPFKKFHIGHLMPNIIGESLARIFEFSEAQLKRVNYQGDIGMHVAKAVWALKRGVNLQEAYAFGHKAYEENEVQRQEIAEINKKIYERSDREINKLYDLGRKESLLNFEIIYKRLNTRFDKYFFEGEVANDGKKIVLEGEKRGIFERGDNNAIIFKGEKFGSHTRVFINSEGQPTYEAKDLALSIKKYKYFKYDTSIIVTANEQNSYFQVMLDALNQINPSLAKKTKHIGHGLLKLPSGKMSSRTGTIVPVESFIENVKKNIKRKIGDRNLENEDMEKIAIGAIKYSILKQSIGSDIIFDFDKSISFEGDSGPYLQYSYARAQSVVRKAKNEKIKGDTNLLMTSKSTNKKTSDLERMMVRFPEIVQKAGEEYEPHIITLYLTELAREFNNFYANNKIVDKNDEFSPHKVALTQAFSIIIKNGLWLLGISAPTKM